MPPHRSGFAGNLAEVVEGTPEKQQDAGIAETIANSDVAAQPCVSRSPEGLRHVLHRICRIVVGGIARMVRRRGGPTPVLSESKGDRPRR
jgi:hypothetical protein